MNNGLGRLDCRICGRSIYFPLSEVAMKDGERLIELTCSRGHSDSYWDVQGKQLELQKVGPNAEMSRAAVVGF
jgi:hypothetical protein